MPLFFPRIQEFTPLFRLAEEIEQASRQYNQCSPAFQHSFAPRFDVKETDEAYELNGELPGIEQSNVNIEWSDDATLSISGNTSRHVQKTNAPEAETTEAKDATPAPSDADEWTDVKESAQNYQKPTVEDEGAENNNSEKAAEPSKAVTETKQEKAVAQPPKNRYWLSERSYGNFKRSFKFSSRVEHDEIKASLKNGVLSVVIPKAKPRELRKVTIN